MILDEFPDAQVKGVCLDKYPVELTISTGAGKTVWTGSQKQLFSKNRWPARPAIVKALRALGR